MQSFLNATSRIREPEIMDDPALDGGRHAAALRGLSRLNYLSGSAMTLWPPLAALARQLGRRRLRVLDVASGGGDVPVRLWRKARPAGLHLEIHGDGARSVRAALTVREATAMARAAGLKGAIVERRWPLRFLLSWQRS